MKGLPLKNGTTSRPYLSKQCLRHSATPGHFCGFHCVAKFMCRTGNKADSNGAVVAGSVLCA
jgi:hypothetical protein